MKTSCETQVSLQDQTFRPKANIRAVQEADGERIRPTHKGARRRAAQEIVEAVMKGATQLDDFY